MTVIFSLALLDLFLSFDTIIFSAAAFPPLWNSDQVNVSVSINFPSKSKGNASIHHTAFDYSCVDWDSPCDHLRDIPWEKIFKLSASAAGWDYVYIPHPKYQVKPHSSAWFSAAYAAAIVCTNRINLQHLKWNSDVVIVARGFLEHVTLAYTNKTNSLFFSGNFWNSRHFILINVQIFL